VAAGARKAAAALGRLMPNIGGPSQAKRQLLMSVVQSRLLYGAEIWAEPVLGVQKTRNLLSQAQRCAALRVARCYRSVSDMASLVLAKMPPVFLLTVGRKGLRRQVRREPYSTRAKSRWISTDFGRPMGVHPKGGFD